MSGSIEAIGESAAAMAAGDGTVLVKFSAAAVMLMIRRSLCPHFTGKTGACQTTEIALALGILPMTLR